jgi:hypothetical protein
MAWVSLSADHDAIIAEIENQSDRAAAIVAFSFLEDRLADLLVSRFEDFPKIVTKVMRGVGPLATFSAKNDLALLMGLYDSRTYRDLVTLKDIRNKFAHAAQPISFRTQSVIELCNNLIFPSARIIDESVREVQAQLGGEMASAIGRLLLPPGNKARDQFVAKIAFHYFFFGIQKEKAWRARKPAKPATSPEKSGQLHPPPLQSPNHISGP